MKFSHVVMIDDKDENLASVNQACVQMKLSHTLIHWFEETATLLNDRGLLTKRFQAELGLVRIKTVVSFPHTRSFDELSLFHLDWLKYGEKKMSDFDKKCSENNTMVVVFILPHERLNVGKEIVGFLDKRPNFLKRYPKVLLFTYFYPKNPFFYNGFLYTDGIDIETLAQHLIQNHLP